MTTHEAHSSQSNDSGSNSSNPHDVIVFGSGRSWGFFTPFPLMQPGNDHNPLRFLARSVERRLGTEYVQITLNKAGMEILRGFLLDPKLSTFISTLTIGPRYLMTVFQDNAPVADLKKKVIDLLRAVAANLSQREPAGIAKEGTPGLG